jgi:DNA invertase Pin-like site-specific DNA recombinase
MPANGELPYAIYCRLSRKKPKPRRGRRAAPDESVARQEQLNLGYATEHRLPVSREHVYVDPARSAWKRNGIRPEWDRMMAAARAHQIAGVIAFKIDRLSRNVRDAEDLIEVAEAQPLILEGPGSGRIDLATAHGRRAFREATVQAAAESDNTRERVKAAFAEMTAAGFPLGGGRAFGFEVLSEMELADDDENGEAVTAVQRPEEVEIIREMARRMLAGESLSQLADDLNKRGITTTRGGRWTGANLGRMLGHQRYGGWVEYQGKNVGRISGEPVLDEATFRDVQAILAARRRGRRPAFDPDTGLPRWPLTGIMHCGNPKCDPKRTLAGHQSSRPRADGSYARRYVCAPGNGGCGLSILASPAEETVAVRVLADSNNPRVTEAIQAESAALTEARDAAQAEVDYVEERMTVLEEKLARGETPQGVYDRTMPTWEARYGRALAALREVGTGDGGEVTGLTREEWDMMPLGEKRATIRRLHLRIAILPLPDGAPRNVFIPERVQIAP